MIRHLPSHIQITVLTPTVRYRDADLHKEESFRLHCFAYAPRKWQILAHQPGGLPFVLKYQKRLFFLLPCLLGSMSLNCYLLARKADVIHANWSINGLIAGLVGMILRKPVMTTLRGSDIQRAQKSRLDRFLLRLCVRLNHRLIAVSRTIRNVLVAQFPSQQHKFITVSNGVGQEFLDIRRAYRKCSPVVLMTAGSLTPQKGMHIILQAVKMIKPYFGLRLQVLGDGPCMAHLQRLSRELDIYEQVSFLGDVPPVRMPSYLEAGHVFMLASFSEGRPNVILEAMAAGLPVIASAISGIQELISDGENGLLFPAGSAQGLAAQLEQLLSDIALQKKLGEAGRRYILENGLFMSRTAERYQNFYEYLNR